MDFHSVIQPNLFHLFQILGGLVDDKNHFVKLIAGTFGLFKLNSIKKNIHGDYYFHFFILLGTIILDRSHIYSNCTKNAIELLQATSRDHQINLFQVTEIIKHIDNSFPIVHTFIVKYSVFRNYLFSLKPTVYFNPFSYHEHSFRNSMLLLSQFDKYNTLIISKPKFKPKREHLSLMPFLKSTMFYSIVFDFFSTITSSKPFDFILIKVVLSLLLLSAKFSDVQNIEKQFEIIRTNDIISLAEQLPTNFYSFLMTPIEYKNLKSENLFGILKKQGSVCDQFFDKLYPKTSKTSKNCCLCGIIKDKAILGCGCFLYKNSVPSIIKSGSICFDRIFSKTKSKSGIAA
jgi:hypothetical protein